MDEERQNATAQVQYVETVDEDELPADSARRLSRNYKSLPPGLHMYTKRACYWHPLSLI